MEQEGHFIVKIRYNTSCTRLFQKNSVFDSYDSAVFHSSIVRFKLNELASHFFFVANFIFFSDFGLSRWTMEGVYTGSANESTLIPVRWAAMEVLRGQPATTKSDVWSFGMSCQKKLSFWVTVDNFKMKHMLTVNIYAGVVMWEILTLGKSKWSLLNWCFLTKTSAAPYPQLKLLEILAFLASGNRLEKPSNCRDELQDIMSMCWVEDQKDRVSFREVETKTYHFSCQIISLTSL